MKLPHLATNDTPWSSSQWGGLQAQHQQNLGNTLDENAISLTTQDVISALDATPSHQQQRFEILFRPAMPQNSPEQSPPSTAVTGIAMENLPVLTGTPLAETPHTYVPLLFPMLASSTVWLRFNSPALAH